MNILLITSCFPFGLSETFLDPEIGVMLGRGIKLSILPAFPRGAPRLAHTNVLKDVDVVDLKPFDWRTILGGLYGAMMRPLQSVAVARALVANTLGKTIRNLSVLPLAICVSRSAFFRQIDHVHVQWAGVSGSLAMAIGRLTGVPWSMTCHRWDIYEDNLLAEKGRCARFVRFISRRGLGDAVGLGVPSDKAVVVYMGVSQPCPRPTARWIADESKVFRICCPANLIDVKGHRYLLQAMRLLADKNLPIRLELVGEGELQVELQELARELSLEGIVRFSGFVDHEQLLSRYERGEVHLVVLASVDLGGGLHEGVPVSLMEAMAYGIPVVSTRTGSIAELIPDDMGVLVPHSDPEAIAAAILRVYGNSELYSQLSYRCHEIIARGWTVEVSVDTMLGLIRRSTAEAAEQRVPCWEARVPGH